MFTKEKFLKEDKNRYICILDKDHFFTIQKKLLELGFKYCTVLNKDTYNENMKYFIIFSEVANRCEIHPRPNIDNSDNSIELTDAELYDVRYKYNIGDVVKYVDAGQIYSNYGLMFKHLNFEDKKYNPGKNILVGSQVTIFNRIVHHFSHQPLYAIRFKNEEVLIDEEGLENIEDNSWKIAIHCDDYQHGSKIIEHLTSLKPNVINPREFDGTSVNSFYYVNSDDNCIRGRNNIPEGYKVINSSSLIESKHIGYIVFKYEEGEVFADIYKEDEDGNCVTNSLISMIDDYIDTSRDIIHKNYSLSVSPMNQEQIEWYKECLKQNTILDFPLKNHDKIEDGYYNFNFKNGGNNYIIKIINNNYYYILESQKMWSGPNSFTNRNWINDYDITFASDDKVKWMDICIEKNRFVDKHELPALMSKNYHTIVTKENQKYLAKWKGIDNAGGLPIGYVIGRYGENKSKEHNPRGHVKGFGDCISFEEFAKRENIDISNYEKETVENTRILSKDYIEGKYYYSKFNGSGNWHEIIFKYNKNPEKRAFIQLTRKKLLYDDCCNSDSFTSGEIRRFATEEEIKWLDACIKANKFIEQNEIPNIMIKIPINQIITEACLQDKPNIILENYNIKGMDDITFADDGQLCGGAKLGSKNTMGCTGLSCTDCKINCNQISRNEILKWLFRDFQGNLQQELDDLKANDLFLEISDPFNAIKYVNFDDHMSNSKIKFIASEEVQVKIPKLTINKVNINFLTK